MNFLEGIFERLARAADRPVLQEIRDGKFAAATGGELLSLVRVAREFIVRAGLRPGDRCALLAPNSIGWAAMDLALMAEGVIVVPLYSRHAPRELAGMIRDSAPALLCCGKETLRQAVASQSAAMPRAVLFDEIFSGEPSGPPTPPRAFAANDPVTIIYTSGTSGEPKGVVLGSGGVGHILSCTNARIDQLMGKTSEPDRVFHYPPFCFAGSWILLLTCLSRSSVLSLSTDLTRLGEELKLAAPNYFLNVPTLLERVRAKVEEQIAEKGGIAAGLFRRASESWRRLHRHESRPLDPIWLALANALMFPTIRKSLGPNLRAILCGSAPLAVDTQLFFFMLGVPVLQIYGLTETTAICTLDDPNHVEPGWVGPAVPGIEMKLGESEEILVRGPNIFLGYWNRPDATASAMEGGWFHTGDQGETNSAGNWRIAGRLKNLIVLNSGHKVAPEPLEDLLLHALPGAQQAMIVGNGRGYLVALIGAATPREQLGRTIETLNTGLPHYKQIRGFHSGEGLFTIENGLLAANGKLKRALIAERLSATIEELYRRPGP